MFGVPDEFKRVTSFQYLSICHKHHLIAMPLLPKKPKTDTAHWYKNYREWLQTGEVRKIAEKVRITGDEELEKILKNEGKPLSIVEIIAKNGKLFEACVEYPIGHPKNPLSREELIDKFRSLTIPKVGEEKANLIVSTIKWLEKVTSISDEIKNWSSDCLAC